MTRPDPGLVNGGLLAARYEMVVPVLSTACHGIRRVIYAGGWGIRNRFAGKSDHASCQMGTQVVVCDYERHPWVGEPTWAWSQWLLSPFQYVLS